MNSICQGAVFILAFSLTYLGGVKVEASADIEESVENESTILDGSPFNVSSTSSTTLYALQKKSTTHINPYIIYVKKVTSKTLVSPKAKVHVPSRNLKNETNAEKTGQYKRAMPEMLPVPMALESSNWFKRDDDFVGLDNDGEVCVLAYFHLKITVYYTPKITPADAEPGSNIQKLVLKPNSKTRISGLCDRKAKIARLVLTWPDAIFAINFGFDDLIDSWFVSQFSVQYDTSTAAFKGLATEEKVEVVSKPGKKFWTTNRHRSFRCLVSHAILLTDKEKKHSTDVDFGQVRVQALTWNDRFLTPVHCVHRVHRDEMVPVMTGGTLALLTLLTIAAYGGFRYFKVKNVEYETMQL